MTREQAIREAQRRANRDGRPVPVEAFGQQTLVHPTRAITYLTGATNAQVRRFPFGMGLLVTPDSSTAQWIGDHPCFAVDNGMYGLAKRHREAKFDAERF